MLSSQKYINTVPFSGLLNWSVQYLSETKISFNTVYPMMRIGEFLKRNKTVVDIQNDVVYKRVTIKVRNGGVIQRDAEVGKNIGTKRQFLVSEGQFILSKIDARNGAMGIIPAELEGAIVTQDFLPYDINKQKINPQYLVLVSTTKEFVAFCQTCSSGTTNRQRVEESKFLDIKIPLPSIKEQNELVDAYNKQMTLAAEQENLSAIKQLNIETYLSQQLGVNITKQDKTKGLSFISFADVSRWDTLFFFSNSELKSDFKNRTISDCVEVFMKSIDGKSLRRETYKTPESSFRYIGMEHIEKDSGELLEMPLVKGRDIKSQTISIPKGFFIYGKLRPYLNKYWYNNTDINNIVCSSELFVFKVKDNINNTFFKYVLSSQIVQKQIAELTSGARMPRINETVFMNIQIPLPPIEIQNEIVEHINALKSQIKTLRTEAESNRAAALQTFEQKIFQ